MKIKKLSSLSVFFPCFNEEQNIPILTKQLLKFLPQVATKFEIIIINDGSYDQSGSVADKLAIKHSKVSVVHHQQNLGYGTSIRSGFKAAKFDWLFFTDGDIQFDITQLKQFITYTNKYQIVIGYRANRAEGFLRAFNARLFKVFIDVLYRLHVRDIDCAFKLIKTDLIKKTPLSSTGAFVSTEFLYKLKKKGIAFKQLPVNHYRRLYGTPTGNNPKVVFKAGFEALKLYWGMKFMGR